MVAARQFPASRPEFEDPLDYLPRKVLVETKKNKTIYNETDPATHLYAVLKGAICTVRRCRGQDNKEIAQIYGPEEFFNVSSFVSPNGRAERAIALCQPTHTMAWSKEEIEDLVIRQPKLGIALIQAMLHQSLVVQELLHSVAFENLSDRVARMILRLCGRLGERVEDGSIRMPALTHDLLGKCVGTSREIVTLKMNEMRRRGYLRYSRQNIFVYEDALREHYRVRPA